jgi:hypothetical protein
MAQNKPLVIFDRPWFGPKKRLPLETKTLNGTKVTLQERDLASLLRVDAALKKKSNGKIRLHVVPGTGSWRSHAMQKEIHSHGGVSAPEGWSGHEQGICADLTFAPHEAHEVRAEMAREGWHQFSTTNDPGHFSRPVTW